MKKIIFFTFALLISANIFAQYKIDTVVYSRETDTYSITIRYPKMYDAVKMEYQKDFNLQIEEMVKEKKRYYEQLVKEMPEDIISPYSLYYSFDIKYYDKDFISILFYSYEFTGGAHGITVLYSYNYDFYQRKIITLDDMFFGDYLDEISRFCIEDLKKAGLEDEEWIKEGAAPKPENFTVYNFLKDGILFTFPHYQVGPYAIGTPEVFMPFDYLKKYMKKI